jgi:hypothetical protein
MSEIADLFGDFVKSLLPDIESPGFPRARQRISHSIVHVPSWLVGYRASCLSHVDTQIQLILITLAVHLLLLVEVLAEV